MSTISIPNSTFDPAEVSSYIQQFTQRVMEIYLSGVSIATKVKYINDVTTDTSLVTIYVDGSKELYAMVNTPDMSEQDKDAMIEKLSMMFNIHILDVISSLKALSSEIAVFGWKIDSVYPLIRNMFGFGGMNHKTNTPIYGVADFRFVLYMSAHLSADNGVDGLRLTPLCNNSPREGTPMLVTSADAPEFKMQTRRTRNLDEETADKKFVPPISPTIEELATPNSAYSKKVAKDMIDHVIGGGAFASRALKWIQEKTLVGDETVGRCMTRIKTDYSKTVEMDIRKKLPSPFFQITCDPKTNIMHFPSATAQSMVLKIACEESLRFLVNWKTTLEEISVLLEKDAPTIGWRAKAIIPLVYDLSLIHI